MFAMVTLLKLRIIQLRITNLGALLNYRSSITKLRWYLEITTFLANCDLNININKLIRFNKSSLHSNS